MLTSEEFYELIKIDHEYKELKLLEAYDSFWEFCLYMDYEFFKSREKVLKTIAEDMQRLVYPKIPEKEIDILNVSLPPRTGKSYLCTLFCSWTLGKRPQESILRTTVTAKLYNKFSKDLKTIILGESHNNRYNDIFPHVKLKTEAVEGWEIEGSKQGISYFGAGFEGSIIGFGASLLSIVDDSIGDEFTAMNEYSLEKKWQWYTSAQDSREEKGCKKLFIGTRWSNNDIVGKLESQGFFDTDRAVNIVVPCLIDGKSYCEEIHTTEKLLEKKKITSDFIWSAEWMQQPVEAKGLVFPLSDLNRFDLKDLNKQPDGIIAVGDIADEGMDSLSVPIGYIYGDKVYVADVLFTKDPIEVTQPETASILDKHQVDRARFESNNGGKAFAMEVKRLIEGKTTIKWKKTTQNKHTRIIMKSGYVKENFYFRNDYELGSEYDKFMRELTKYNKQGKVEHDDAPDSITMLAEFVDKPKGIKFLK